MAPVDSLVPCPSSPSPVATDTTCVEVGPTWDRLACPPTYSRNRKQTVKKTRKPRWTMENFDTDLREFLEKTARLPTPKQGWVWRAPFRGFACQSVDDAFKDWCATKIQASFLTRRYRREFLRKREAAITIQKWWKGPAKTNLDYRKRREKAAAQIQRSWRRWKDRKIFLKLKEIASFLERHAKSRLICKEELAILSDNAMGAKLRLRFCGNRYPPSLVYKIFICCANADLGAVQEEARNCRGSKAKRLWHAQERVPWKPVEAKIYLSYLERLGFSGDDQGNGDCNCELLDATKHAANTNQMLSSKSARLERTRKRAQRRYTWMARVEGLQDPCPNPVQHARYETFCPEAADATSTDIDPMIEWSVSLNYESYLRDWYNPTSV